MKKITKNNLLSFLLFSVLFGYFGCQDQTAVKELEELKEKIKTETQKLEANKALVKRAHAEVWNKGNMAVVNEIYSPDYIAHWITGGDTNLEALKNMINEARKTFPDIKEEIIHIVAEGDLVITHFNSSGTMTGPMGNIPPTGKKGSRPEIAVHRIKDGKIVEQWTVADLLSMLNQLGIQM